MVENVRGAQKWVGRARWNFGSFYLWGDVPALMPHTFKGVKVGELTHGRFPPGGLAQGHLDGIKQGGSGAAWFDDALNERRKEATAEGRKVGKDWFGGYGGGFGWDCSPMRRNNSRSPARKAASAMIAKIPLPLSRHIAAVFR